MKNSPTFLLSLTLAGSMACSLAMATAPTVSSAIKSGTTMTITGSDFGIKSTAAPVFHSTFSANTQGDDYAAAGFDFVGGNSQSNTDNYVDKASGAGITTGHGAWRFHMDAGNETFNHFGTDMPANNERVYASYFFKIARGSGSGTTGIYQIKQIRTGSNGGYTGPTEGADRYYALPKYGVIQQLYPYGGAADTNDTNGGDPFGQWFTSPEPNNVYASGPGVAIHNGQWHYLEAFFQINTLGNADGVMEIYMDGTQYVSVSNLEIRTATGQYLDYVQYMPGFANEMAQYGWDMYFSNVYSDNSRARVFLGNNASLSSVTGRYLLPPTAWTGGTDITVSATNIPSGYSWVYVVNDAGETNSSGYAYTGC